MQLPIQVVEAIIFRRNGDSIEYLLLKRLPDRSGFWHWQPVTGGLEEGETRTEALYREIEEETGIKSLIRVIEGLYYFEFSDPNLNQEYVYGVEVSSTEEVVLDGREHNRHPRPSNSNTQLRRKSALENPEFPPFFFLPKQSMLTTLLLFLHVDAQNLHFT
jgi:ADP-ribose pyrophosphatase YjhB (NUDIX family)